MTNAKPCRRIVLFGALAAVLIGSPAAAQDKIKVVATFSILGDLVKNVGGDRIELTTLVGPNGDAHVYSPSPADTHTVHDARIVVVNGLGLEGWMTRLVEASGSKAVIVVASRSITPRKTADEHQPSHLVIDPHAWQSVANAKVYVANIRDGLANADPAGRAVYETNAAAYLARLDALEAEVKAVVAKIPANHRKVITTHDALGYFGDAYGMEFIAPKGVSTDTEASAKDVARIISQIRAQHIPAVFLENISDPRLIRQIARETGAKVGGTLYSDALSPPGGPAASYIDMIRNNVREFDKGLAS